MAQLWPGVLQLIEIAEARALGRVGVSLHKDVFSVSRVFAARAIDKGTLAMLEA